jgi:hypothetical protein
MISPRAAPVDPWWRSWAVHNLVAHPVGEVLYWGERLLGTDLGLNNRLHDATLPTHEPGTGRG